MFSDYFPFGMAMPKRNNINNNYRYAYQGQEKDPETGKEAFELRLWDSRIGRWLTTDPAGQYHSPYMAMGNNPIRKIDPDGGTADDIYELKDDGHVNLVKKTNDNFDVLLKGDKQILKVNKSSASATTFLHDLAFNQGQQNYFLGLTKTDDLVETHYAVTNFDTKKAFEVLSNNSNVEWTYVHRNESGKSQYLLGVSHDNSQGFIFENVKTFSNYSHIKHHIHSHPGVSNDSFQASGNDINIANKVRKQSGNARFEVYAPQLNRKTWNAVFPSRSVNRAVGKYIPY